jgi:hypothetical protein
MPADIKGIWRPKARWLSSAALFLGVLAATAPAAAQPAYRPGDPIAQYNADRAYRHFLTSPYSYRTYSGLYPGYSVEQLTPYGYEQYRQGPTYIHERITPRGRERYEVLPARERVIVPYPVVEPYPAPSP